jgi:hypothetical protein
VLVLTLVLVLVLVLMLVRRVACLKLCGSTYLLTTLLGVVAPPPPPLTDADRDGCRSDGPAGDVGACGWTSLCG